MRKAFGAPEKGSQPIEPPQIGAVSFRLEKLPPDARERVEPEVLADWVRAEVQAFTKSWENPPTVSGRTAALLEVLAFAYACNLLASEQISLACNTDPALRLLCGVDPPFPAELASFRRRHRAELVKILAGTFARIMQEQRPEESPTSRSAMLESARERLDMARHLDLAE